ncbi:tRNA (adenosine(37)-N6)-threonylcarbamoyltransferase complex dimerization subunit type 1 TsaB [Pseudoglutamicibacter albus]|uniref:tRNA threonylcarbamoyl adenosine modification protein YeaZ n=1 Tax=Pseudoglutamicibacter albus TaxID=98671 RepID=A0ABU1Z0Q8_9MICC|nr:tRNA (adenosine(37)-N6)-threonylcarbamoyltransferase complex dimerization subunit type 1 TsaB [Pseudoglutamicibacter albus]MDR7294038.1 tRNA threonylcarbamoyl adenosine modification protein YeaZ [Pseudoglutamicibacter albus]
MRDDIKKILALDTSSVVSVACVTVSAEGAVSAEGSVDAESAVDTQHVAGVEVIAEAVTDSTTRHAEDLIPVCKQLLAQAGWERPDAVLVGEGPGPFTGLRVGIAAGQTLAFAWGIEAYGVCSLDGLAAQLLAEGNLASVAESSPAEATVAAAGQEPATAAATGEEPGEDATAGSGPVLTAALDARRRELYWATYARNGARVDGPHVTKPDELPAAYPVGGAGAGVRGEELAEAGIPVLSGAETSPVSAAYLARAWYAAGMPTAPPVARYLRESDAVVPAAMQGRQR